MSQNQVIHDGNKDCLDASRILVLTNDPADVAFACGGAILRHAACGTPIGIIVAFCSSSDPRSCRDESAARKRAGEQAAAVLGCEVLETWDLSRDAVLYGETLVGRIVAALHRFGADVLYAPSVEESDPARREFGMAAVEAIRRSGRGRLVMYEVDVVIERPDRMVDITAVKQNKQRAMACFSELSRVSYTSEDVGSVNRVHAETPLPHAIHAEAQRVLDASYIAKDYLDIYASEHRNRHRMSLGIAPDNSPLVSVLMRSMDRDTIMEALDSIALQTYPNIEVIVANARGVGHRPLSELCGRFPLKFLDSEKPLQRSVVANHLLLAARGEWLQFLDDDDWLDPDHIASVWDALTLDDVAAYASVRCVDNNREVLVQRYDHAWDPILLRAGNYLPIHSVLFSRRAVELGCRFDETLDIFEDWDFWLQVARFGSFRHTDRLSAAYRIHHGSGWGVRFDKIEARQVTATVLRKWQTRWSDDELVDFADRLRQLDSDRLQMAEDFKDLRAKVAHWESEAFRRGDWATTLDEELAASYRSAESTTRELVQARNHWERAQDELRRIAVELERSTADLVVTREELVEARRQWMLSQQNVASLVNELQRIEQDHEDLVAEVALRREQVLELEGEVHRMREENAGLNGEIGHVSAQAATTEAQLAETEAQLAEVYKSTSWGVTAPIRALVLRVRAARVVFDRNLQAGWRRLPITIRQRILIKSVFFRAFAPLLSSTNVWRAWSEGQAEHRRLRALELDFASDEPQLSVVVTDAEPDTLVSTLVALRQSDSDLRIDLIVADRGRRWIRPYLELQVQGARRMPLPPRAGLRQVWQSGTEIARADRILFLPSYWRPAPGSVGELLRTAMDPALAGVVPMLLNADDTIYEAGCVSNENGVLRQRGAGEPSGHVEYGFRTEVVGGSVLLLDRALLKGIRWPELCGGPCALLELSTIVARDQERAIVCQPLARMTAALEPRPLSEAADAVSLSDIWAADPPQTRKRIPFLVIDLVTPTPDQDSGSVDAYSQLKILHELGYQPSFLPSLTLKREGHYTGDLERIGVECWHRPWITSLEDHLRTHGGRYRYVMISREPTAASYIDLVLRTCPRARIIFNTVDLHFLREQRQAEHSGNGTDLETAMAVRERELGVMRKADITILISATEQDLIARELPDVRTYQVPLIMEISDRSPTPFEERRDVLFIGGFRHLPNVDAVSWFVTSIWPQVKARIPGARLHVVGSNPTPAVLDLAGDDVLVHGFVPDVSGYFNHCRLSVAPLRFGAGLKGKVGRSLGYGLPVVATPMAAEGSGLSHGEEILVAVNDREFADGVVRLYEDEALWTKLSAASLAFFEERYSYSAGRRIFAGLLEQVPPSQGLECAEVTSGHAYREYRDRIQGEMRRREAIELALGYTAEVFTVRGNCIVCDQDVDLACDYSYCHSDGAGNRFVNWRERLVCPSCQLNNRMRAAIHLFGDLCRPAHDDILYLTEQTTPLFAWFDGHYQNVIGSEHLGNSLPLGEADSRGIRNEDVTRLTLGNESVHHILSFDVLEHVPDYQAALSELFRVLKPGGWLFFSVPFATHQDGHVVRARIKGSGEIEHLMEPEYHGDPLSDAGCLCFYHFGWNLLDDLRAIGFTDASARLFWSREFGYLGGEQMLLLARKPLLGLS
ncbi:glycosyltransferase [Thiocapsa rosea]|uniref:Glycosyltransferase involved in cell wall biosynthesis n=1 Tax=Thiocapsa rosea TaxID=69360 RepID=A0A495V6Z9_9GAMM|nr:glycosyltransferase [Thiocapsa rosea]RKT44480.1 glycosyltransferase involved in cell wall biosynthesis [Thiocapsa rosea]